MNLQRVAQCFMHVDGLLGFVFKKLRRSVYSKVSSFSRISDFHRILLFYADIPGFVRYRLPHKTKCGPDSFQRHVIETSPYGI